MLVFLPNESEVEGSGSGSGDIRVIMLVFLPNVSLVRGWGAGFWFWNYEGHYDGVPVK